MYNMVYYLSVVLKILLPVSYTLSISDKNACITDRGIECCYGYILSTDHSRCEVCPPGYYGKDCIYRCPSGQYGSRCISRCTCTATQTCDKAKGCISKKRILKKGAITNMDKKVAISSPKVDRKTVLYSSVSENSTLEYSPLSKGNDNTKPVIYIVYSGVSVLIILTLVTFFIGIVCIVSQKQRNIILPNAHATEIVYDEIDDEDTDRVVHRLPNHNPPLLQSNPESYYTEKEYDYAYKNGDQCYLNPYCAISSQEYTDHYYKQMAK